MATDVIAAAPRGGKGACVFDRSAILRAAHAAARERMEPSPRFRQGDRPAKGVGYVPKAPYRVIFASCLRWAWRDAKIAAEDAAFKASLPPIPADVADRIAALESEAWGQRITSVGNAIHAKLLAEARDLRDAARGLL